MNKSDSNVSGTSGNLTANNGTSHTSMEDAYSLNIHDAIITVGLINACFIITANTSLIVCFVVNRNKTWPLFVAQIFCLSLSDLFVGLSVIPWLIIPIAKPDHTSLSYIWCSVMLYLLSSSQIGSLYHLLTICVHRCYKIETSTQISTPQFGRRVPYISAAVAWSIGFVLTSLPFILWTNTGVMMHSCLIQEVFVDSRKAMGVLGITLIFPQVLTNVLYLVACFRMRYIWRRVQPVAPQTTASSVQTSNAPDVSSTNNSGTNFRKHWRFMGTIGIVMLLFNICTIPVLCLAFFENSDLMTSRDFRYTSVTMFVLNSAFNPFVYAYRSPWLKNALKKLLVQRLC